MLRRLAVPALLLLTLAYVPGHTALMPAATPGEGAGPARFAFRAAILPPAPAPAPAAPEAAGIGITADTCVDGVMAHDETGGAAGAVLPNLQIQLWDKDSTSADDLLDADLTDSSGAFLLCSAADDTDDPDDTGAGLDLYVRAVTENGFWRVQDAEAYKHTLPVAANLAPGTTHHYGLSKPADPRAFQIFNALDRFYAWTAAQHVNDCWDALDHKPPEDYGDCRQLVVQWQPGSATQAFYDSAANRVQLGGADFAWRDAVVREAAKAVMDDLFEDDFPDTQNCGDRTRIRLVTTVNCAWVNGLADWVATQVFADPVLDWQVDATVVHENLETPSWDTPGWERGDAVEGRVAGALLDFADASNETPWDRKASGPNPVWLKLLNYSWGQRLRKLADLGIAADDNERAALYQNTIDYGLRDPLTNAAVYLRRTPEPAQNFRFTTTSQRWSVMAIRPPSGSDYDVRLYGTSDLAASPLATSTTGISSPDFVVVDSSPGKRALGTFYPQVTQYSGTGQYDLKFVQATFTIGIGQSSAVTMTAANPVAVMETTVAASTPVKFEVTQPTGGNPELLLFCSTTTATTWVRGRPLASAAAPQLASGTAGTETLTWNAPATAPGDCAVVLVNKSGSGTYTVTRKS